jgi:hypothetical protein
MCIGKGYGAKHKNARGKPQAAGYLALFPVMPAVWQTFT